MKACAVLILILALAAPALARDETLLGDDIENGGYGALVVKYGKVMGRDGFFVGGQGGWIINHALVIGAGGYGLVSQIDFDEDYCSYLGLGYGGLLLEYIISSNKLVHVSVQTLIGAGGIGHSQDWYCEEWSDYEGDAFFALEPGANLELNLHKIARVAIGGTYLYVSGVRYRNVCDSDLSGFMAQFMIKFGSF
jgi:hypothetical protein